MYTPVTPGQGSDSETDSLTSDFKLVYIGDRKRSTGGIGGVRPPSFTHPSLTKKDESTMYNDVQLAEITFVEFRFYEVLKVTHEFFKV